MTARRAWSAKITTKNSGRLPSVACSSPVTAGRARRPTCSVANDTIHARRPARAWRRRTRRSGDAARVAGDAGERRSAPRPRPGARSIRVSPLSYARSSQCHRRSRRRAAAQQDERPARRSRACAASRRDHDAVAGATSDRPAAPRRIRPAPATK